MRRVVALLFVFIFLTASCVIVIKPASSATDTAEDSWVTKAPMQQARGGLGVAAVNGKIYAIGGSNASGLYPPIYKGGFVGTNEEYDPATDMWSFKTPMPTPRSDFAIVVYQNKIYCIGGVIGFHFAPWEGSVLRMKTFTLSGKNEVYDPATDTWETKASAPIDGMLMRASVLNDKIYLIDGKHVEVYDPANDSWELKAEAPISSDDYGPSGNFYDSAVVGNTLYVFSQSTKQLFTYDEKADVWNTDSTLSLDVCYVRAGATVGVMAPKRIYFLCLLRGMTPYSYTQIYDPATNSWTTGSLHFIARMDFDVAVLNDKLYAIGGYTFDNSPDNGQVSASTLNKQYTPIGYGTPDPSYTPLTDNPAPEVSIASPKNETCYTVNVPLSFTVNEPSSWMRYRLDGNPVVEVKVNSTLTELAAGSHNVTVYATDAACNTGVSETIYFTVDDTAPAVSVMAPENITYDAAEIQLNFTVNEQVSWMGYSLDSQPKVQIAGNTTLTGLSNGAHNLTVYAKDIAGNNGVSEIVYFRVEIPFSTIPLAVVSAATVALVGALIGVGLLIHFKKRGKKAGNKA
jgi:hypothetical protein